MRNSKKNKTQQVVINNDHANLNEFLSSVKIMIGRLKNSQYHELELTTEKWGVKLVKDLSLSDTTSNGSNALELNEETNDAKTIEDQQGESEILKETSKVIPIKSQIVGLFWGSPARNGKSKICQGDLVKEGQIIGAIEAVNIMHRIEAPTNGRILEILAEDGDPVEYGQFIFLLETGKSVTDV